MVGGTALAGTKTIQCSFTEPFFSIIIDLAKKTVVKIEPDWNSDDPNANPIKTVLAKQINIRSGSRDPFLPITKIIGSNGATIMILKLNFQGSDGMSSIVYPIEGSFPGVANTGGCSTNLIPSINPEEQT
jgi:hypothetical protein